MYAKWAEYFLLDTKNTYRQSGKITETWATQIILNTGHAYGTISDNEYYRNSERGKASKYIRKVPNIQIK
jgi:hypothetical protein